MNTLSHGYYRFHFIVFLFLRKMPNAKIDMGYTWPVKSRRRGAFQRTISILGLQSEVLHSSVIDSTIFTSQQDLKFV